MECLYVQECTTHHLRDRVRFRIEIVLTYLCSAIYACDVLFNSYRSPLMEVNGHWLAFAIANTCEV